MYAVKLYDRFTQVKESSAAELNKTETKETAQAGIGCFVVALNYLTGYIITQEH